MAKEMKNDGKSVFSNLLEKKSVKILIYLLIVIFAVSIIITSALTSVNNGQKEEQDSGKTNLAKNYCTPESRKAEVCIAVYEPVCGWFSQPIKCVRYPCAATYSNACFACMDEKVEYWTEGECPSGIYS
ncbi:MAG: hypothetical protein N3G74_01645 [Candidatus Micrarchaeota archaeon]|nr:hypothetical protein [Candidatus Micrarchaeota archaeon]